MSFEEDLEFSLNPKHAERMDAFYRDFFSATGLNVIEVKPVTDRAEQKKGYDKLIKLDNEQFIRVEEKLDRYTTGNLVLELWSDSNRKRGWLFTSTADYLAYHFTETGITHMLPMILLRRAWALNEKVWRSVYEEKLVRNRAWTTIIIPIPTTVLRAGLMEAMAHDHISKW
jgi:hypothetical protein